MRKALCYYDSKDQPHPTLASCQISELVIAIPGFTFDMAEKIVEKSDAVMNILNVTEKSRLAARKLNGAKRKSRVKPEQASLPIEKPY